MSKAFANDYVEVNERIVEFFSKYPDGSLQADPPVVMDLGGNTFLMVRAYAYRSADDPRPGVGTAWEIVPGRTPYTKFSEAMNAETSAWGRALAALGIATKRGIATREEVEQAKARQVEPEPPEGDVLLARIADARNVDDLDRLVEEIRKAPNPAAYRKAWKAQHQSLAG